MVLSAARPVAVLRAAVGNAKVLGKLDHRAAAEEAELEAAPLATHMVVAVLAELEATATRAAPPLARALNVCLVLVPRAARCGRGAVPPLCVPRSDRFLVE